MRALLASLLFAVPALAQQHVAGGSAQLTASGPVARGAAAFLYRTAEHGVPDNVRVVDLELHKADLGGSATADCSVELWLKDVPVAEDTWAEGSTQTLAALQQGATRVFQGTGLALPQAMGFVRFQQTLRGLSFDHVTGNIAVLVVTDCASSRPLMWKGDALAARGRGVRLSSAPAGTSVLTAAAPFSIHRPQARFTWLVAGRKLHVKVGTTLIPNNARFAPAANSWAAGVAVPQHYQLWNFGLLPITLGTLALSGQNNLAVAQSGTPDTVIMPGEFVALDLTVTPVAAGAAAFDITLPTDDPAASPMRWGFTGTAKAAAAAQLDRRRVLADGTSVALTDNQMVDLGNVVVGGEVFIEEDLSNYGSLDEPGVVVSVTPGKDVTATVESAPATAKVQEEGRTRVRAKFNGTLQTGTVTVTVTTASGRLSTVVYRASPIGPEISIQRIGEIASGATDTLEVPLPAGMKVPITYVVTNTGYSVLSISDVTVSEETGGTAVLETPAQFALGSYQSAALTFGVTSTAGDSVSFTYRVMSNDYDELTYTVKVVRAGMVPKLTVLAGDHVLRNGEDHFIGEDHDKMSTAKFTRTMVIRNDGDAPLTVMSVTAAKKSFSTGDGPSGCAGQLMPAAPPGETIAPGQSGTAFVAEVDGSQAAQEDDCGLVLTITSDDQAMNPYSATLTVEPAGFNAFCSGCAAQPGAVLLLAVLALIRRRTPSPQRGEGRGEGPSAQS